jgi:hypothetical protein
LRIMRKLVQRGIDLGVLDSELDAEWASTQMHSSYLGLASLWYLHGPQFDLRRALSRQAHDLMREWSAKK